MADQFHNPYNFIPAPLRADKGVFADGPPASHARYLPDHWSGRLSVSMQVKTPLLVVDGTPETVETISGKSHSTYGLRKVAGKDGLAVPAIPPTSIKGMIRAAVEAVTNGRFGVLQEHTTKLGRRLDSFDGQRMVPAMVETINGKTVATLMLGTNPNLPKFQKGKWLLNPTLLHAAWIYNYPRGGAHADPPQCNYTSQPLVHGEAVGCWLQRHTKVRDGKPVFQYWRVVRIWKHGAAPLTRDKLNRILVPPEDFTGHEAHRDPDDFKYIENAWIILTNRNIKNKHCERVFFADGTSNSKRLDLSSDHIKFWNELLDDGYLTQKRNLDQRRDNHQSPTDYLGGEPGRTALSRHTYNYQNEKIPETGLPPGEKRFCYARMDNKGQIAGLYPVQLARTLNEAAPADLVPDTLRPARSLAELSPAERMFGWVAQSEGEGAYRGNVRFSAVQPASDQQASDLVASLPAGQHLPLAILGQPKPTQWRFYVANSKQDGKALEPGIPRVAETDEQIGYRRSRGLRGRKTYPHQSWMEQEPDYWDLKKAAADAANNTTSRREYLRPKPWPKEEAAGATNRDDQNRSIREWIKPGARFRFDVHVQNLSAAELGALLFVLHQPLTNIGLQQPRPFYHRLGLGKPLGFGSVELTITALDLANGATCAAEYRAFGQSAELPGRLNDLAELKTQTSPVAAFMRAAREAYGQENTQFTNIPWINAYLAAGFGAADEHPVHYPRRANPQGEILPHAAADDNYQWFTKNESASNGGLQTLPDLDCKGTAALTALPMTDREMSEQIKREASPENPTTRRR